MSQEPADLRSDFVGLKLQLDSLERRIVALEHAALRPPEPVLTAPLGEKEVASVLDAADRSVPLAGRSLLVLGGGYLLRALTDAGVFPPAAGVALGMAYAIGWLWRANAEAARESRRLSPTFHGLAASALALPLILESTLRFSLLGAPAASALLLLWFALTSFASRRTVIQGVSTLGAGGAVASALMVGVGTHELVVPSLALLAMAVLQERRAGPETGRLLRIVVATAADTLILIGIVIAGRSPLPEAYAALSWQSVLIGALVLPAIYLGATALRTLRASHPVQAFEVGQGFVALAIGFGGGAHLLLRHGQPTWPLGAAAALLGAVAYVAALAMKDEARNLSRYAAVGGALVLWSALTLAQGEWLALASSLLGLAMAGLAGRFAGRTLRFHCAAYLAVSVAASGLLAATRDALASNAASAWPPVPAAALVALLTLAASYGWVLRSAEPGRDTARAGWLRTFLAAALAMVVAGLATRGAVVAMLALAASADPGMVVAFRTLSLSLIACGLAFVGARAALPELTLLAKLGLAGTGVKLVVEDLWQGRPATLFPALAVYGCALVIAPRLLRRAGR